MKNQIQKDKKKRIYYLNCENTSKIFKSISKNSYVLKIVYIKDPIIYVLKIVVYKASRVTA